MITALFAVFATILVGSALMVILHRNPVTSALFLVLAFCSLAGLYLLLGAEFVGMVQIIVYAGAIMVLFLFVIMYLNLKHDVEEGLHHAVRRGIGWLIGAVLLLEGWMMFRRPWGLGPVTPADTTAPPLGNTAEIGQALYSRYLFPFEVTSILLLVAMVGAVVIAKGRVPHIGARPALAPPTSASATADASADHKETT